MEKEINISDLKKHGIYKIVNIKNKKIYVGSAVDLYRRIHTHISNLKRQKHPNIYLQRAWNKDGEENFMFYVIEYVEDKCNLLEREQYWIDKLNVCDKTIGYNINPTAGSNLGRKLSQQAKINISNGTKGRKLSEETKRKISMHNKGRIDIKTRKKAVQLDIEGNLIKIWDSIFSTKELGFNPASVSNCCNKRIEMSHGYLWFYYDEYNNKNFTLPKLKHDRNKKILQFDIKGNFIKEWTNLEQCSKNGLCSDKISNCCKNKKYTYKNFIWLYKEEYGREFNLERCKKEVIDRIKEWTTSKNLLLQLNIYGELVDKWNGISEAENKLSINSIKVFNGRDILFSNNYIWIYQDDYLKNVEILKSYFKRYILQFNLNGTFIKEWGTAKEITDELGINNRPITQCCNNKNGNYSAYGYLWRYKTIDDDYKIQVNKNYRYKKKVLQYTIIEEKLILIKEWDSILQISEELKFNRGSLMKSIDSNKLYKGFIWKLKEVI